MREIFRRNVFVMASQVGICDVEEDIWPDNWVTGHELAIVGPRGVAVSAPGDEEVEIIVYQGEGRPLGDLATTTEIQVGHQGLYVGTVFMLEEIEWPPGPTVVEVYTEGPRGHPFRVAFLLRPAV